MLSARREAGFEYSGSSGRGAGDSSSLPGLRCCGRALRPDAAGGSGIRLPGKKPVWRLRP